MIPQTFNAWKSCIVNDCEINLTKEFVKLRLLVYQDRKNHETCRFAELYGEEHLQNVINWFKQI